MADYAIHDTTLIGTSNIIRKKEGSSALIDPADYPKRINLMGLLEEKTASGSIVTFSDGADDVPVKSCEVALPASLDGYTEVDVVQCGKNIFNSEIETGNINSSGENEANNFRSRTKDYIRIPTDDLVLSYVGDFNNGVFWYDKNKSFISYLAWGASPRTLTPPNNACYVRFSFLSATYPTSLQLEKGTTPTAFEVCTPTTHTASLGRTIYGGTANVVKGEGQETYGKKVFDGTEGTGGTPAWTMISVSQGTMFRITVSDKVTTSATNTLCSYYTPVAQAQRADGTVSGAGTNVDIIDNRFSSVDAFKAWLSENPITLVYELATSTDFTFSPVEINTRLGANTMWSDGDMSVTYRASGTVTKIAPLLMSKAITANGTYSASDDGVDGYDAVVVNVPSGLPSGDYDDFLGIQEDYTRYNVQNLYSSYYVENELLKKQIVFQLNTGSGYEGFCVSLDGLNLTEGQTYKLSFVLDVPSSVTFSGSYQWGMKHSASRLPTSGSANSNTFNTSTVVDFAEQTGTQNVSITFTAGATNYLIVLLARIAGSRTEWLKMRDVQIEEASAPSLLSMMPSEEVNENTEEVEEYEQNESEG